MQMSDLEKLLASQWMRWSVLWRRIYQLEVEAVAIQGTVENDVDPGFAVSKKEIKELVILI